MRRCTAGPNVRAPTRRAGNAPTLPAAVRPTIMHYSTPSIILFFFQPYAPVWFPRSHNFTGGAVLGLQVEVTGATGTTGVSAARRATPVPSVASGCVKAADCRATSATARERRSGPVMRRSALVSVCVCV